MKAPPESPFTCPPQKPAPQRPARVPGVPGSTPQARRHMPGPRSVHLAHLTPTFSSSVSFGQVTKPFFSPPPSLLRNCQTKPKGSTNYGNPEERSMGRPFLFTARCWSVVQQGLGHGHWAPCHSPPEHRGAPHRPQVTPSVHPHMVHQCLGHLPLGPPKPAPPPTSLPSLCLQIGHPF